MASGEIIGVKIQPYLKEFFIHRHGPEPIKATQATKFFVVLAQYLTNKGKGWRPPISNDEILLIELPFNKILNVRSRNYIPEHSMPEIRKYLYGLFYGAFISYMNDKVLRDNWAIKYAIINFIDEHDMSWDKTNYETLKKIYDRYRHPKQKKDEKKLATPDTKKSQFCPSNVPQNYGNF